MNLSTRWLSDYVAHGLAPDALADVLTMSGLEVESVETTGPSLDGVVVGTVLDVRPHPNADRLRVCDVDLGADDGAPVQIVCGAPNVAAGQAVPVATVGTELMLPARDGSGLAPVTIKKGKIRGEVSFGMICAEDELGLGDDHDGILVLDPDTAPGTPFADYLAERGDLPGDAVLDLAITPNRPDATSHVGVARDVAALTGAPLTPPLVDVPEPGGAAAEQTSVTIEDAEACPRFAAMVVRGVTVGPSPEWMQERLVAVGLRPISNVVDVTNFVMLELGQPLHAYDLDRLTGERLVVRRTDGEAFTTLDGAERELPAGTIVVRDAERTVGIAGVMGGRDSEVSDSTTNVLVEGALWDPGSIRRTAKALGLQTDASYRFERGVDPTLQARAVARAAALIAELGNGELVPGLVDETPVPHAPRTTTLRTGRLARVLGAEIAPDEVERLLTAIGFEVTETETRLEAFAEAVMREEGAEAAAEDASAAWTVGIPPWRPDVEREIDLIEEVARLWGYDNLPAPDATPVPLVPASDTPAARLLARTRRRLAALGLREAYTNSLVPQPVAEQFADAAWTGLGGEPVQTLNPISQEMAALRPSLLPGLLAAAAYNRARGAATVRLFGAGHVMARGAGGLVDGYAERPHLALVLTGAARLAAPGVEARDLDVLDLKGLVVDLLADLGVEHPAEAVVETALVPQALELRHGGRRLGALGRAAPDVAAAYDLDGPVLAAELDWDAVAAVATRGDVARYAPISRHPTAERDLALVVPEAQPAGELLATIRTAGRPLLQEARLFDVYRGDGVPEGSKSLAVALRFGADRTLRDKEVDGRVRKIVGAVKHAHGATLRE